MADNPFDSELFDFGPVGGTTTPAGSNLRNTAQRIEVAVTGATTPTKLARLTAQRIEATVASGNAAPTQRTRWTENAVEVVVGA